MPQATVTNTLSQSAAQTDTTTADTGIVAAPFQFSDSQDSAVIANEIGRAHV